MEFVSRKHILITLFLITSILPSLIRASDIDLIDGLKTTSFTVGFSCASCSSVSPLDNIFCCGDCANKTDYNFTNIAYTSCTNCNIGSSNHYNCLTCAKDNCLLTVYRFSQMGTGDHSYSQNRVINPSYVQESSLGLGFTFNTLPKIPLVQLVGYTKPSGSGFLHFYTTSSTEGSQMMGQGWSMGGTIAWILAEQWPNTLLVYRLVHPATGIYLMTTDLTGLGDISSANNYWQYDLNIGFVYPTGFTFS